MAPQPLTLGPDHDGQTVAALVRALRPGHTWSQARRLVETRRVRLNGELILDPARRVHAGDAFELLDRPAAAPRQADLITVRHLDEHIVVAEKPSGLSTVRHPAERAWDDRRKALSPTLEDLLPPLIARREGRRQPGPRLRVVHRLDKETSGLVVFARTVPAERLLGKQFHAHTVTRRYLAVVPGRLDARTVRSFLVRDRGDGRRGSTREGGEGKEAVTHLEVAERLPGYTLLWCRLETGRTHQIRIHLAELGHPVCGEKVYNIRPDGTARPDGSGAPWLALHAAELGLTHPAGGERLLWEMPLPPDLEAFVARLRAGGG
jgi:23S rRNA pseudouridine1911/1915/1917 synthase